MGILVDLFHGHHTADEQLEDWGFEGPVLGPFPYYHITYNSTIFIGDEGMVIAGEQISFLPEYDSNDFFPFLGAFYGDVSILSDEGVHSSIRERLEQTQEAFKIVENDFGLYINHPVEWVRHYVNCKLKGII